MIDTQCKWIVICNSVNEYCWTLKKYWNDKAHKFMQTVWNVTWKNHTVCVQMIRAQGNDNTHKRALHINKFTRFILMHLYFCTFLYIFVLFFSLSQSVDETVSAMHYVNLAGRTLFCILLGTRLKCGNRIAINMIQLSLAHSCPILIFVQQYHRCLISLANCSSSKKSTAQNSSKKWSISTSANHHKLVANKVS